MKRSLTLALAVGLSLGTMTAASGHGNHSDLRWNGDRWHDCQVRPAHDMTRKVKRIIRCAVDHYPTSLRTAMYVASRESGFTPGAHNSCCHGVYQQHEDFWPGRVAAYNRAHRNGLDVSTSVYDARANVMVSIWQASKFGWGAWSTA